eukprot:EG_transcript_18319
MEVLGDSLPPGLVAAEQYFTVLGGAKDTEAAAAAEAEAEAAAAEEERRALRSVVVALQGYEAHSCSVLRRLRKQWDRLPERQRQLLEGMEAHYTELGRCIRVNQQFLDLLVGSSRLFGCDTEGSDTAESSPDNGDAASGTHQHACGSVDQHAHSHTHSHAHSHTNAIAPSEPDIDKVRSTLRQFVRDWGAAGQPERDACYGPMLQALDGHFSSQEDKAALNVLVPGAGLSRLAFEVLRRGYSCQGNEFSFQMLWASDFILNRCQETHVIHPYIHQTTNNQSRADACRPEVIPDVFPAKYVAAPKQEFSMVAGDFLEVYATAANAGAWDAVLTCFFIDTAHSVFE